MKRIYFLTLLFVFICVNIYSNTFINYITKEENRNEVFRNVVFKHLTDKEKLTFLIRKEIANKILDEELAAQYILQLIKPYDRKFDASIGKMWSDKTTLEKKKLRLQWFNNNTNNISLIELQKYIMINKIVEQARIASNQYNKRKTIKKVVVPVEMTNIEYMNSLKEMVQSSEPVINREDKPKLIKRKKVKYVEVVKPKSIEQIEKQKINRSDDLSFKVRNATVLDLRMDKILVEKNSPENKDSELEQLKTKIKTLQKSREKKTVSVKNSFSDFNSLNNDETKASTKKYKSELDDLKSLELK